MSSSATRDQALSVQSVPVLPRSPKGVALKKRSALAWSRPSPRALVTRLFYGGALPPQAAVGPPPGWASAHPPDPTQDRSPHRAPSPLTSPQPAGLAFQGD